MHFTKRRIVNSTVVIALALIAARTTSARPAPAPAAPAQSQTQSQSPLTQQVGTVKAINGNTLTLTPDAGRKLP